MVQIADWMARVADVCRKEGKDYIFDEVVLRQIRGEVRELCTSGRFPVPGIDI